MYIKKYNYFLIAEKEHIYFSNKNPTRTWDQFMKISELIDNEKRTNKSIIENNKASICIYLRTYINEKYG